MRKRVVFILPALTAGGAERVMITLMNGINREKFEPSLIYVRPVTTLRSLIDPSIPVTGLNKPGSLLLSAPGLLKAIHKADPDIIVSTMAPMNFTVLLLKPMLKNVAIIVREAITPSFLLAGSSLRRVLVSMLYKGLYPLADRVISPAKNIIDEFCVDLNMDTSGYNWLPNPVDESFIRTFLPASTSPGELKFIASGRLHRQKGFDRLIDALQNFHPILPWSLTILGDGTEKEELSSRIDRAGLSDFISLAGHVENPWPFYAAADAFLLPSRYEGLPNVALEALACGTPVIAMREAGGIAEIADKALPGSILLASAMEEFINKMLTVSPRENVSRPSLLPGDYALRAVLKKFESILNETA